jgi:hypothetical protein
MSTASAGDRRAELRNQLLVGIVGILIGALSTAFTKFIESEVAYQNSLKVVEYYESCKSLPPKPAAEFISLCTVTIKPNGRKVIKGVKLTIFTKSNPEDSQQRVPTLSMNYFSSPPFWGPTPKVITDANQPGIMSVRFDRLLEPQTFSWYVTVSSHFRLEDIQIAKTVTIEDEDARVEEGSAWRWKRWLPDFAIAGTGLLVVAILFAGVLWALRKPHGTYL